MTYRKLMNDSIVAILVGFTCLVIGYMIGRSGQIPVNGVNSVSAQEIIDSSPDL